MIDQLPKAVVETSESLFFEGGSEILVLEGSEPTWEPLNDFAIKIDRALPLCLEQAVNMLLGLIQVDDGLYLDYHAGRIRFVPVGRELYAVARAA